MGKSLRVAYGEALVKLGQKNDKIVVLDADLAGATKTAVFKKAFPDRHFNCGIAEADMMSAAAGAAAMGLVPFASSFAMFAAGRATADLARFMPGGTPLATSDFADELTSFVLNP